MSICKIKIAFKHTYFQYLNALGFSLIIGMAHGELSQSELPQTGTAFDISLMDSEHVHIYTEAALQNAI